MYKILLILAFTFIIAVNAHAQTCEYTPFASCDDTISTQTCPDVYPIQGCPISCHSLTRHVSIQWYDGTEPCPPGQTCMTGYDSSFTLSASGDVGYYELASECVGTKYWVACDPIEDPPETSDGMVSDSIYDGLATPYNEWQCPPENGHDTIYLDVDCSRGTEHSDYIIHTCVNGNCGDGYCSEYEQQHGCPQDCGYCGDGTCQYFEDEGSCPYDCWQEPTACDYGLCDWYECPENCYGCGDGICDYSENDYTCPEDCSCIAENYECMVECFIYGLQPMDLCIEYCCGY